MDSTTDRTTRGPAKASGKGRRWLRRGAIGAGIALVVFTVLGFLVVPPVARRVAQTQLGTLLGRKVVIDRIRLNPFALSLAVEGFHIFEADGNTPFVEFKRFYVNAQLSSVYRRAPVVQEISLDGLRIHVERRTATPGGWGDLTTYNFSDVIARLNARPPAPPAPPAPADAAPPRFSVNNIRLTDGKLVFEDRPLGARHEVSDLSFGIPFVSTLPVFIDSFVEPGLSVRVDGTPFVAQGRSKPFKDSQETTLELRLDALDLTRYVPFVPMDLPFAVDSARLTVALDLAFVRPRVDVPTLSIKGRVALADLDVREKRGAKGAPAPLPLLKLGQLELVIADANLTSQHLHLSHVRLDGLELHARRQRNGGLNLQQMVPRAPASDSPPPAKVAKASKPAQAAPPPRFVVDAIDLTGIKVHLDDQTTTPAFHTTIDDTFLAVRGLSNAPGASATVEFGARAVPGGVIKQHGTLVLEPHLHAKGTVTVDDIEPGRFAPYYADQIAFDIMKGKVRLGSAYDVEDGAGGMAVKLEQAFVELADFALRRHDKREDFLRMGFIAVRGAKLDLNARQVAIGEIALTEGKLRAERDEKGVVDLSTLAGSSSPPPPSKASAKPVAASPPTAGEAAGPAWAVTVAKLDIDKWGIRFDDRAVQPRAQLSVDPLSLHLTDISTAPGARMGVNLRMGLNRTGTLTVTGTGGYQPVAANLRYDLKGLEIVPFQPYFKDQVSLDVTGGALSIKGQANVEVPAAPAHGGAARPAKANVETDLEIAGFTSVDRARKESLVQWKAFRVTGVKLTTTPMAVRVGEIGLDDLQARVALLADGGTNLAHAFAPPPAPGTSKAKAPAATPPAAPKAAADEKPPQIDVGQVVIQRGVVLFSDRTVQPNVSTEITDFGGRISGLSTTADTQANIDLHAAINRAGSLSVTGQANPLAKDLFADVKVDIKDVDLPPASPYAGRYVGYVVEKGKLGVSLAYHVANRKLEASNRLVLDQFTFGGKTDSAEAVKVPVRLAVAILKDRHGVIDLELPIAGSLDDPEFKVGRLILKVLGNLVVKAVTAPFSYIASAFGGGDELSRLDFAPGSIALESKTQQKLTSLTKALTERPGLSFEVEGIADPKRDRENVRRQILERLLAAERVAELQAEAGDSGKVVPAIDNVRLAAADRPRLLEKLYKAKMGAKPPVGTDVSKPASPADLEKALFEHVTVSDDELRALALRRATLVQATLTKAVAGAGARLFLLKPRLDAGGARVDFHLKQD